MPIRPPAPPRAARAPLPPPADAIDIVYLWVDGSDPRWQERRRAALARADGSALPARHGDVQGRYRDNGELRYNLRALQRFFTGHGHVYIVTDGQCPAWLRPGPGLSLVDHRTLLPPAALPVFDSGHIESYLHHIPGLAERFLYLNDDVFLGAPFDPALWFGDAGVAVYKEEATLPDYDGPQAHESALVNASLLSRRWLTQRDPGYRHVARIFAHSPRPMLTSALRRLEGEAAELFAQVRSTVFRSWAVPPLLPDLVPRWMLQTGLAVLRRADSLYVCSGDADAAAQFDALAARFGALPFFCINDTSDDAAADAPELLRIGATLAALLPTPSRFEREGAAPRGGATTTNSGCVDQ
ncbi:stealth family protein [Rugamonas rubra]|uniref:Stealth protein CR1, conserved region 1 n=1 Tax=Rugamonas rubra TaxID=758825 RepID=A0A1I4QJU1_9BURK|nr:stealth family protein [Rugamonas rubra]SFM40026.1 Stealth protein CR1, conserved region 1 [Rugamonas rubra]